MNKLAKLSESTFWVLWNLIKKKITATRETLKERLLNFGKRAL